MSKRVKVLAFITVVLSFCALCAGFANLQDTLTVDGSLNFFLDGTGLMPGEAVTAAFKDAITESKENDVTVTTIILDNCYNKGDIIEAAGLNWEDAKDVSVPQNDSIKLFTVGDTIYVLAQGDGIITFNADSSGIFSGLTDIVTVELNTVDLSQCTDLTSAFEGCTSLENVINTTPNLSAVTSVEGFFKDCSSLKNVNLDGLDLSSVCTAKDMFSGCVCLTSVDLSNVTFSKALQDVSGMFEGCTVMNEVNLTGVEASGVLSAESMFRHCEALTTITGASELDMSSAQLFTDMFAYCTSLTSLDLSGLNASSAVNTAGMFGGCQQLASIDLYGMTPTGVTDMSYMFSNRGSLDGDTSVGTMQLTTVYVPLSWSIPSVTADEGIFLGTEDIIGGEGFVYNGTTDKTYAVADKLSVRGYLSLSPRDWGELYTVVYHTFDENSADYEYKTVEVYENREIQFDSAPPEHSAYTFLGWSPMGSWISDEESTFNPTQNAEYMNNSAYRPEQRILYPGASIREGKDILFSKGGETPSTITHVYDLYQEFTVTLDATNIQYNYPNFFFVVMTGETYNDTDTEYLSSRCYDPVESVKLTDGFYLSVLASEFYPTYIPIYSISYKTRTHYVHPGLYVFYRVRYTQSTSDSTYDYSYSTIITVDGSRIPTAGSVLMTAAPSVATIVVSQSKTEKNQGGGSQTCFASGTMITLADGTQKPIEELTGDEFVLTFNHETGSYEPMPLLYYDNDGVNEYSVINLMFEDGSVTRLIGEHALFDMTLNKYVYIRDENCVDFIGHQFAKDDGNGGFIPVTLAEAYITEETVGCYSITSLYHLNYYVDGMISLPGAIDGLFNYFEYDPVTLQYDEEKMLADIETYGLYTYEDFAEYATEEMFETILPAKYLKIAVGKGLITFDGILELFHMYLV